MTARKRATKKPAKKRAARTPPFSALPDWSEAKFWGFIRAGLRATYNKWPPKWTVLKAAQRPYQGSDKRCKWEYQCAKCGGWFKAAEVSVDHKVPAGQLRSFDDLPAFCERLFCSEDGLQVLHKACHDAKTLEERRNKDA